MITGISACTECQAELHPGDNFCQDCGAGAVAVEPADQVEERRPPAVLTCLACGCQSNEVTSHCPSCGSLMSDVGVYTRTTLKALPSVDLKTVKPVPASELAQPSPAKGLHLTSPLLKRNRTTQEKPQNRVVYKSPTLINAIVDLSPGVLLLAFFALVVVWFIDYDRDRSPLAFQAAFAQAQSAVASDRLDQAIQILDKLSVARSGDLTADERALFNHSLYKRALSYAGKGDNKAAMFDLLRISRDYTQYADARAKLAEYGALVQAASEPVKGADTVSGGSTEGSNPVARVTSESVKKADGRLVASNDNSVERTLVEPNAQATANEQSGGMAGAAVKDDVKYTDAEVARYNKLLAEYFSTPRSVQQEGGKRSQVGDAPETRDPPTLREWLEQGKPNF